MTWLKKELHMEYATLLTDMQKEVMNIWKIIINIVIFQTLLCKYFVSLGNVTKVDFKWVEDISKFHGRFIKICHEERDEGYLLVVDIHYLKNLHKTQKRCPILYLRGWRLKNSKSLSLIYIIKLNMLFT